MDINSKTKVREYRGRRWVFPSNIVLRILVKDTFQNTFSTMQLSKDMNSLL